MHSCMQPKPIIASHLFVSIRRQIESATWVESRKKVDAAYAALDAATGVIDLSQADASPSPTTALKRAAAKIREGVKARSNCISDAMVKTARTRFKSAFSAEQSKQTNGTVPPQSHSGFCISRI